ncbi:MAG: NifB/NifX family molybdenum-iron cluster-binding protein [Eubacteriales bacterium]|nr:NifB/NifX family molybdenum-iron cluster-binding protein [Eubacteriales bacterium]
MKIAMPTDGKNMNSTVCMSFGRTPYFLIYDTETKTELFLDNSAAASQGGAGIKAAEALLDNGINALLTPRCGENAAKVFYEAKVDIYKTVGDSIQDNIDAFLGGRLLLLDQIHPGFHNHGGK